MGSFLSWVVGLLKERVQRRSNGPLSKRKVVVPKTWDHLETNFPISSETNLSGGQTEKAFLQSLTWFSERRGENSGVENRLINGKKIIFSKRRGRLFGGGLGLCFSRKPLGQEGFGRRPAKGLEGGPGEKGGLSFGCIYGMVGT